MDLGNRADESLLHYYEGIRREVEADRKAAHRVAGIFSLPGTPSKNMPPIYATK
jgi:hypothetical protein